MTVHCVNGGRWPALPRSRLASGRTLAVVLVALAALAAAIGIGGGADPAVAAVRQCMQPITSEIIPAPSEMLGRQMALRSWSDKTRRKHGEEFTSWRVAARKVLGCRPATDGSAALQCVAFASPCRIQQVPGQPPPQRRKRTKPGEAIET